MGQTFSSRHIGSTADARQHMLDTLGYGSITALLAAAVPAGVAARRVPHVSTIPPASSESRVAAELRELAGRNVVNRSLIGLGYYDTVMPAVIRRTVFENPHWYTAYTPYQPEIAQGRLEALLNFQTMVADLTGLDVANASMLDESTAAAEAMLLLRRVHGKNEADVLSNRFIVDADVFPQTKAVLTTRAEAVGIELVELDLTACPPGDLPPAFGALLQYPGASGRVADLAGPIAALRAAGTRVGVAADLLAMTLLTPPGELGADVAVGSVQRFGLPLGFGGPHAGFLAVRGGLERQLPGRLVGVSRDAEGAVAYRLSLQTREQHIRRERATSNLCTSAVLPAVLASFYAVYHGPDGLRQIALGVNHTARLLAASLRGGGLDVVHDDFFDTVQVRVSGAARRLAELLHQRGYLCRLVDDDTLGFSVDETTDGTDLAAVVGALAEVSVVGVGTRMPGPSIPSRLLRSSPYLEHDVFQAHHSETSLLRYIRRLGDRDYALDNGMIALGSCTMKLTSAVSMEAVSLPGFAGVHPFAPVADVPGYLTLTGQLEGWLAELTGYDSVSLQPNAGSQGELAGLLAIREYHRSRGEARRTVCLIPSSAHGTNAASAVLAGMSVVVIDCARDGSVDLFDAARKLDEHGESVAALMVTYPSTHGVYEKRITELCDLAHAVGAQVYIDGANLNAALGVTRFGDIGGDVSHLNLHKTFAIPHGGGGQGVGPVAAKAHLAPFLPGHPFAPVDAHQGPGGQTHVHGGGAVSAAPFGGASILPVSWAYIRLMGLEQLTRATGAAVLAGNYIAARLAPYYPVLYTGEGSLVAHECVLDLRPLQRASGITSADVAKRLIDYGFHAPTLNFPVAGTLMIEPTESEDLGELDRFVDAMIAIRAEIDDVAVGVWPTSDNPLVNAPHTVSTVSAVHWDHPYSREVAAFPVASLRGDKFWPAVRRIDEAYGDRNLVCSCDVPEAYAYASDDLAAVAAIR